MKGTKIAAWAEGFSRLGKREKKVLLGGAVFLFLLIVWLAGLSPFLERMAWYDRNAREKEKDLAEMGPLREEYRKLKIRMDEIDARIAQERGAYSFPAYLESVASDSGVKGKMTALRPLGSQSFEELRSVDMEVKLEDVPLAQTVDFLSRLEHSPHFLYIRNLHMRARYGEPKNLDVTLTVSRFEKSR